MSTPPGSHPIEVELDFSPPPPAAPPLSPPPTARAERPRSPPRTPPVPRAPPVRPPPPERPSSEPSTTEPSPPLELDAPLAAEARRPSLLPSLPPGDWSLPLPEEKPRGRTIRPGDPSLSPETLAAEEHARVSARVRSFTEDDLAARRVENGLVDPYFSEVRESLEKQLEGAPLFKGKTSTSKLQQFAQTYLKDAERYGHSGLVGKNQKRDAHKPLTPLEKLESLPVENKALEGMRGFLRLGDALQQHAEPEPQLVVILELQQAPDGQLRSVQVVEPSGDKAFDKYVSEAMPPALARLAPPPSKTPGVHLGTHSNGIRTLWSVEGRVVHLKQVSEMKEKDAAYAAAMASLGALAGRFDETTGEVQVIDLLDPKFRCRARLLRVW
ncbi:TonB C-terminal domain-containing protein [Cystobacter ferrugineus]|uniref:TonB C-terminal domain-containing protein n=1 Tax=Cystobacter ferrugineus TaxID=83449 RepID=UPI001FE451FD|nr:TonB C-terminal domain-containing protein [Cystobacter ferrugineus]